MSSHTTYFNNNNIHINYSQKAYSTADYNYTDAMLEGSCLIFKVIISSAGICIC